MIPTIEWTESGVVMLDQRRLPAEEVYNTYTSHTAVAEAIRTMVIRGAPAIGIAAAMGIALGVGRADPSSAADLDAWFERVCSDIRATRPTAVNLFWAVERMRAVYGRTRTEGIQAVRDALVREALEMHSEDIAANRAIGRYGQGLLPEKARVLTHCNAGALATAGYGTALGVIRAAVEAGKQIHVFADETRPFLQGARLTAWELEKDSIPVTVITDNMAGHFLKNGNIDCVVVGADRIAANGDTANKIGTLQLAIAARHFGVRTMVVAPSTTVDLATACGADIHVELRNPEELLSYAGMRVAAPGVAAWNPVFDVTPAELIEAIVTERGVVERPNVERMRACFAAGPKSTP
jgi:methylthioribose-1-phosphate isomerase